MSRIQPHAPQTQPITDRSTPARGDGSAATPVTGGRPLHLLRAAWTERGGEGQSSAPAPNERTRFRGIGTPSRADNGVQEATLGVGAQPAEDSAHIHQHGDLLPSRRGGGGVDGDGERLDYDTTNYPLDAFEIPESATDRAAWKAQLGELLDEQYGAGNWSIDGVTAGSDEELRAMYALYQYHSSVDLGGADQTGTESDLLVPGHGSDPTLRVTTQTDADGAVTATVHDATGEPTVTQRFSSVQEGADALAELGITVADVHDPDWEVSDLEQIYYAVSLLSDEERAELDGLHLAREANPPSSDPTRSGLHSPNAQTEDGVRAEPETITFYDRAFEGNERAFLGDGVTVHPDAATTIVHEIGHAISKGPRTDAVVDYNAAVDRLNAANDEARAPLSAMNEANAKLRDRDLIRATNDVIDAMEAINDARTPEELEAANAAMDEAVTDRDTTLAAIPVDDAHRADAVDAAAAQDAAIDAMRTAGEHRVAFRIAEAALDAASDGDRSARLASFEEALEADSSPTDYGRTEPEEAFAESFLLFKTDPEYLETHRPAIYRWFADGNHLR